jgi:hypothetical protein
VARIRQLESWLPKRPRRCKGIILCILTLTQISLVADRKWWCSNNPSGVFPRKRVRTLCRP